MATATTATRTTVTYNNNNGNRCYTSGGSYPTNGGYASNGNYSSNDPYYPQQGRYGTDTGRTVATVVGGLAGAVLGSKVGGGSGQVAAAAIGSMVGGLAGRQIYEGTQRRKYERSSVTVCDDQYGNNTGYNGNGYNGNNNYGSYNANNDGRVVGYDVTYEYAGRQFTTRTDHHPGDRIRVRVDVDRSDVGFQGRGSRLAAPFFVRASRCGLRPPCTCGRPTRLRLRHRP